MKFSVGVTYVNDFSQDLAILVVKNSYSDSDRVKLKVRYVSKFTGNVMNLPSTYDGCDRVEIQSKDFKYWKIFKIESPDSSS